MLHNAAIRRLSNEVLVPVEEAAKQMGVLPGCVMRWIYHGKRGRKLDALKRNDQWYTSREALKRFKGEDG